ncbi:MAG: hypothetical protein QM749_17415 [Aquabacterium sp.]
MGDSDNRVSPQGKLVFKLHGEKLAGLWELVRIAKPGDTRKHKRDGCCSRSATTWARPHAEYDVTQARCPTV